MSPRRWMLAAALAALAAGRAAARPRQPDYRPPPPAEHAIGFDHLAHDGHVAVAGADAIPCARCHALGRDGLLVGRPDHAACFGDCHGPPPPPRVRPRPYPVAEPQRGLCRSCHSPTAVGRAIDGSSERLTVFYPPYQREQDYGIALSHARHQGPTAPRGDCRACHAPPDPAAPAPAPIPHARCAVCHLRPTDAATPAMSDCAACHPAAFGYAARPRRVSGRFPVAGAFSHQTHLDRGGRPGAGGARAPLPCAACHQAAGAADGDAIPLPSSATCDGCHDGRLAFSTLGTDCRRCHERPAEPAPHPGPERVPFSHRAHRERAALQADCDACHRLAADGAPLPAAADHRPCSDSDCHREQFAALEPTICRACHVGSEPWRPLHTERWFPTETEFGARFSHRRHLAGEPPLIAGPCTDCHRERSGRRDMRLPRDHAMCAGDGCHRLAGGAAPALGDCGGCHQAGLVAARLRAQIDRPWSVRARFRHDAHRREPGDGAPVKCEACHPTVTRVDEIARIEPPGKATCARCHDGDAAFALTGHGCARCHEKPPAAP